jgi:hypothetical protein
MRWAVLAIAVVACGIVGTLWSSGGAESTPMLVIAMVIVLVSSIAPLCLSKRRPGVKGRGENGGRDR